MHTAVSKLKELGLSEYEARAYTSLLRDHPLTAYETAKASGIPTSKIYEVIRKLENKNIIQSIHGERSRMFIPLPPDEFIRNYRSVMEGNLGSIESELKNIHTGIDIKYTWHINNYSDFIARAIRMIDTARSTILLLTWPSEINLLLECLRKAEARGIHIAVIHYGPARIKVGQVYPHPVENSIYAERNVRGFTLVADSKEALNGSLTYKETEVIWSMNQGFVIMAESYLRHDIYQLKTIKRFDPVLKKEFGNNYEKMTDIYNTGKKDM